MVEPLQSGAWRVDITGYLSALLAQLKKEVSSKEITDKGHTVIPAVTFLKDVYPGEEASLVVTCKYPIDIYLSTNVRTIMLFIVYSVANLNPVIPRIHFEYKECYYVYCH